MTPAFIFSLIVLGFCGIVAQTVLIRESLIIYGGNELTIGMIIGSWAVWEALGAYIAGRVPHSDKGITLSLITANLLFVLFFPATIVGIRLLKIAMGLPPEMSLGIATIFVSSLVVFLPCSFLHGFSFTESCRLYEHISNSRGTQAARSYFLEMAGTIIGGLAVSYVLITRLHSIRIAFLILVLMSSASFFLGLADTAIRLRRTASAVSIGLAAGAALFMLSGLDNVIQARSITAEWHGRAIVLYENSLYQNIVVTREEGQYTFFTDGIPNATLPVPDIVRVEEIVHIPALAHGSPRDVLIIHGGPGGVINEMLRYPTLRLVDYVEIDPAYLAAIAHFPSSLVQSELQDKRVRVHYTDGRRFVKETPGRYDIVLSGIAAPRTLQANRFFTSEFFREVRNILKPDGVFVFTLPGSLAYYDRELKDVNASILGTASGIFRNIAVIPGDENIFMATSSSAGIDLATPPMDRKLREYALATRLITRVHLDYRLDRDRVQWFQSAIRDSHAKANHDFTPVGLYYSIAFDNALHNPSLKNIFTGLSKYGVAFFILISAGLVAACFLLRRRYNAIPVFFVISTTGFAVMMLELLLIFVYQVWSGYVFHEIGMLITMLMTGMAAGSLAAGPLLRKFHRATRLLAVAETALAAVCISVPVVFLFAGISHLSDQAPLRLLFFILLFVSGLFAGMEFPVAVKIYRQARPEKNAVGPIYGADLIGGFFAGVAGGFFLFPLMGLVKTCIFLFAVKLCGIVMLLSLRRK